MTIYSEIKLFTEQYGVKVTPNTENALCLVELSAVKVVSNTDEGASYETEHVINLTFDYEELDELIDVLKLASSQLKRGDNEFAK